MKVYLTSFAVTVARHERFETIVIVKDDDGEYKIPHTNVRLKARLKEIPLGSMLEARLYLDLSEIIQEEETEK
jgi:hypothetical protein